MPVPNAPDVSQPTRRQVLQTGIQDLLLAFTQGDGPNISLPAALETLAMGTNALFGTTSVGIWLHDRRGRLLTLAASSSPRVHAAPVALDADEPPARGLRLDRPLLEQGPPGAPTLLAPLRGWRRALGTLVVEGHAHGLTAAEYCDAAQDLSRQLSSAIEKVQLLDEVLRHRRLLENTFNSLVELVVVVDPDGRLVQTNEAFATRLGVPRDDLLARPLTELVGRDLAAWVAASSAAGALTRSLELTDDRLAGVFAVTVTPLVNQDGDPGGQVLVARDITAETRLEHEQAALRQRLTQSEKLASLGQFVAGIAHEMNNPLQGVLGHLELLITASDAARPVRPTLKRIYHEGERAAKIVRNLLAFTGSQRMARRRVKLDRVIARALASRAAAIRRAGITIVRHPLDQPAYVMCDALLLQQAFLNVLINAEHALARQSTPSGPPRIEIAVTVMEGDLVRTTIRDTGSGIAPDVLPRIFDPFFTTKEVGEGTGLGLAITYGIIQEHGGTIEAASASDGGAIFTIDLPSAPVRTARESARV